MTSKFTPGTLPEHESCAVHRLYKLGCDQYERLIARSGQLCEICRTSALATKRRKLFIDHAGPQWAVRGLLCNKCNTYLEDGSSNPPWAGDYLANSWWKQECARVGVPTVMAAEPEHGTAIRDQYGVLWLREGDGDWYPHGGGKPGISRATWEWLYGQRGPQNMATIDLYSNPHDRDWYTGPSEKAALEALVAELGGHLPQLRRTYQYGRLLPAWDAPAGTLAA